MQFGEDEWADKYDEHLKKFGVCSKFIDRVAGKNTGLAQINVAENGENQIVIIPGSNDSLSPSDVENAAEVLDSSKVIGRYILNHLHVLIGFVLFFSVTNVYRCWCANWKLRYRPHWAHCGDSKRVFQYWMQRPLPAKPLSISIHCQAFYALIKLKRVPWVNDLYRTLGEYCLQCACFMAMSVQGRCLLNSAI